MTGGAEPSSDRRDVPFGTAGIRRGTVPGQFCPDGCSEAYGDAMALTGMIIMGCTPGSSGCGQPPPTDGYVGPLTTFLIVEAVVLLVALIAGTLLWRQMKVHGDRSPWPQGGFWASYRRRFKWTAASVAALVAVVLLGSAALGSPITDRVSVTLMLYGDALLVVGIPLSLFIAALPLRRRPGGHLAA